MYYDNCNNIAALLVIQTLMTLLALTEAATAVLALILTKDAALAAVWPKKVDQYLHKH